MMILKNSIARFASVAVIAGAIGLGAGIAVASQPEMEGALSSLQSAQNYLDQATQDKGGHAASARHLVAQAIVQVQEGIAYGVAHGE
jgi:hypothetical protein